MPAKRACCLQILYSYPGGTSLVTQMMEQVPHFCFPHGVQPLLLERTPSMSALNEVIYSQQYQNSDGCSFIFLMKVGNSQECLLVPFKSSSHTGAAITRKGEELRTCSRFSGLLQPAKPNLRQLFHLYKRRQLMDGQGCRGDPVIAGALRLATAQAKEDTQPSSFLQQSVTLGWHGLADRRQAHIYFWGTQQFMHYMLQDGTQTLAPCCRGVTAIPPTSDSAAQQHSTTCKPDMDTTRLQVADNPSLYRSACQILQLHPCKHAHKQAGLQADHLPLFCRLHTSLAETANPNSCHRPHAAAGCPQPAPVQHLLLHISAAVTRLAVSVAA